jgi:hypothetical protein
MLTIEMSSMDEMIRLARVSANDFSSEFIQDLNNEIIMTTPVDLGHLRGSWVASLNEPPEEVGLGPADPSGGATMANVNAVATTMTLGDIYYLVNTAAYAARLEYGFFGTDKLGRKYSQAGRGWVAAAVARAQDIALAAIAKIKARG